MGHHDPVFGYRPSPGEVIEVWSPLVNVQPVPGSVYKFTEDMMTVGGHAYKAGSHLMILSETDEAPFGYLNPQGNFVCLSPDGRESVWSSLHSMIFQGWIELVAIHIDLDRETSLAVFKEYAEQADKDSKH